MWVILLEALAALLLLLALVWWTMFSGRKGGERLPEPESRAPDRPAVATPGEPSAAPEASETLHSAPGSAGKPPA